MELVLVTLVQGARTLKSTPKPFHARPRRLIHPSYNPRTLKVLSFKSEAINPKPSGKHLFKDPRYKIPNSSQPALFLNTTPAELQTLTQNTTAAKLSNSQHHHGSTLNPTYSLHCSLFVWLRPRAWGSGTSQTRACEVLWINCCERNLDQAAGCYYTSLGAPYKSCIKMGPKTLF